MRLLMFAFFIGVIFAIVLTPILNLTFLIIGYFSCSLLTILLKIRFKLSIFCLMSGIFVYSVCAINQAANELPQQYENRSLLVSGQIVSLPAITKDRSHFIFRVNQVLNQKQVITYPFLVRLNWYHNTKPIQNGQVWQLIVKLKRPHGYFNPGGFNYARWLSLHNIVATGYVKNSQKNKMLKDFKRNDLQNLRQLIVNKIDQNLISYPQVGFIKALSVGDRNDITETDWQILKITGTNHLVAISGLHIGLIAGLLFFIIRWSCSYFKMVYRFASPDTVAAIVSLIGAFIYAGLAGFSLPTTRALIMLAVYLLARIFRYPLPLLSSLLIAIGIILLFNPLSLYSASFWLSFYCVGMIIYCFSLRVNKKHHRFYWLKMQLTISLAMFPISAFYFHQVSILSFIANGLAIPYFAILLPCLLMALFFLLLFPVIGKLLLIIAWFLFHVFWLFLTWLAYLPIASLTVNGMTFIVLLLCVIGYCLILLPKGFPGKWVGCCWLFLIFFPPRSHPQVGNMWVNILDVGQGLSVVVRTAHHVLIYDTGPKLSPSFNTGQSVIIPFLQYENINKISMLMISHGDNDHIGGAKSLLQSYSIKKILTSIPKKLLPYHANYCYRGQHWRWDDINFNVLFPVKNSQYADNNSSCVLKIQTKDHCILLTGDIEKKVEQWLVSHPTLLRCDILVAPHHGSKTSSSLLFLKKVQPKVVLFATGYLNRFHFPNDSVLKRYHLLGITSYNTATCGMITLRINQHHLHPECYLEQHK